MTYEEALSWFAFIRKRGSLHQGMRLEAGFALLATILTNVKGSKSKMQDFMPHADQVDELSIDNVFKKLGGLK